MSEHVQEKELTLEQMKKFICDNVNKLTKDDRREIIMIITHAGKGKLISYNGDGASTNLDKLDENIVLSIYSTVNHKIKKITPVI